MLAPRSRTRMALAGAAWLATFSAPADAQYAGATLFSDYGFRGESRPVSGPIGNLSAIDFNDRTRSVRIEGGSWRVCEHADFGGRCVTLSRSEADLSRYGLDGLATSIEPIDDPRAGDEERAQLLLYEGEGFSGREVALDRAYANLGVLDFNDAARSLAVSGRWVVCVDSEFRGRCATIDDDIHDLRPLGLSGAISSARPLRLDDDDRGPEGPFPSPGGSAAEGRTAAFFAAPRLDGRTVHACAVGRPGPRCYEASTDAFCRRLGYRQGTYYALRPTRWGQVLEDVLCLR